LLSLSEANKEAAGSPVRRERLIDVKRFCKLNRIPLLYFHWERREGIDYFGRHYLISRNPRRYKVKILLETKADR